MAEADLRTSPLTLRFADAALEAAFQDHYFRISVRQVRFAWIVAAAFAVITLAFEANTLRIAGRAVYVYKEELLSSRAGFLYKEELLSSLALVLSVLLLALSYQSFFRRALGAATSVALVLYVAVDLPLRGGIFASFPTATRVYWQGLVWGILMVLIFWAFTLSRMSWIPASLAGAGMIGLWLLTTDRDNFQLLGLLFAAAIGGSAGYLMERYIRRNFVANRLLAAERVKTEELLLNVLPAAIADRLKEDPGLIADRFDQVTVLFADLVNFTGQSADSSPTEVVAMLDRVFTAFDELADRHGLEKIKTIGDAYMAAAGLPEPRPDHAEAVAGMALDMLETVEALKAGVDWELAIRIGIASGPVVAGVIGRHKFIYDLWGDTVNAASRMESHGLPAQIQVTEETARRLAGKFRLEERGVVEVKGKGPMRTFWLLGEVTAPRSAFPRFGKPDPDPTRRSSAAGA
jgi:class 3 adenylate cyclase